MMQGGRPISALTSSGSASIEAATHWAVLPGHLMQNLMRLACINPSVFGRLVVQLLCRSVLSSSPLTSPHERWACCIITKSMYNIEWALNVKN